MASVHFSATLFEPVQEKPYFCNICTCANDIVYAVFEYVRTFLYVFRSLVKVIVWYELRVNVPVAIFFPTLDCFVQEYNIMTPGRTPGLQHASHPESGNVALCF